MSLFPHCFCVHAREGEKGKKSWEKPQQRPRKVEKRGKSHGFRELCFWGIIIEKVWKKNPLGLRKNPMEKGEARSWYRFLGNAKEPGYATIQEQEGLLKHGKYEFNRGKISGTLEFQDTNGWE